MVLTAIDNENEEETTYSSIKLSQERNDSECTSTSNGIVLVQTLNPTQGKREWVVQNENYDYMQEIARSAYADMLHDDERNELYFKGIRDAVSILKKRGETVRVLDIGTGTGLLSMMSVECGADLVTACEAFDPMANCAKKIIRANHMDSKIKVVGKRSNYLRVGPGLDMEERANLLVAELLDTELIGEGAIHAYNHAMEHLMTKDAVLVPSSARIYAQVVCSPLLHSFSKPYANVPNKENIKLPSSFDKCDGSISVHDLQMSQLPANSFIPISKPLKIFEFDWSGRSSPLLTKQSKSLQFEAIGGHSEELIGHCVFMWWDTTLDQEGENVLTCAPYWHQRNSDGVNEPGVHSVPWRDHWMQAVYHLPPPHLQVTQGQNLFLTGVRDAYSMWFSLQQSQNCPPPPAPHCCCGIHQSSPRQRIAQLSDVTRNQVYSNVIERTLATKTSDTSAWLLLGDSLNLVTLGQLSKSDRVCQVYVHVSTDRERGIVKEFLQENVFKGKVTILPEELSKLTRQDLKFEIDVVFSEPFFTTSILPWHNLRTNFLLTEARHLISSTEKSEGSLTVLPGKVEVYALPVCFLNLWKIRASCHQRCGFNLLHFDELISKARQLSDDYIDAHPLWEYPCFPLSDQIHLCTLDLSQDLCQSNLTEAGALELDLEVYRDSILASSVQKQMRKSVYGAMSRKDNEDKVCAYYNGVVVWTKWIFGTDLSTSCGPLDKITPGKMVSWDMLSQQGVHLPKVSTPLYKEDKRVTFNHQTSVTNGELSFSFTLDKC